MKLFSKESLWFLSYLVFGSLSFMLMQASVQAAKHDSWGWFAGLVASTALLGVIAFRSMDYSLEHTFKVASRPMKQFDFSIASHVLGLSHVRLDGDVLQNTLGMLTKSGKAVANDLFATQYWVVDGAVYAVSKDRDAVVRYFDIYEFLHAARQRPKFFTMRPDYA